MDAIEATVDADLATTEVAVRNALASQGFGVVSEIDVAANLRNALGIDRAPLKILGTCSPMLAHRALDLACGDGRSAVWLGEKIAIDVLVRASRPRSAPR